MSEYSGEEQIPQEEEDISDGIEMPDFVVPTSLEQDEKELEYYAQKLGFQGNENDFADELEELGFSKIFKGITAGALSSAVKEPPKKLIKAVRTEEEENARKDFTGLLNRVAPSNFIAISARLREAFASYPPPVSIAQFTRCITQRIFSDADLPPAFISCYAKAVLDIPDSITSIVTTLKETKKGGKNKAAFFEALGEDTINFYSTNTGDSKKTQDVEISQLTAVARQMHMTTDVRRSVFFAITTAVDVIDAYTKVSKLKLSKTQRIDVPLVILECCRNEADYNPFYAALTAHFNEFDKKFSHHLRKAIKNTMKLIPGFETPQIRNVALFCSDIIQNGTSSLSLLSGTRLMMIQGRQQMYVMIMLRDVFSKMELESLQAQIDTIATGPNFSKDFYKFLERRVLDFVSKSPMFPKDRVKFIKSCIEQLKEAAN